MEARLAELDPRDLARLRTELCEVIAAHFTYPAYFDYRAGVARVRPIGAARRQEIAAFVQGASLEPIWDAHVASPQLRRFLEGLFLRFLETNADLKRIAARRRVAAMRAEAPRAAAEVQRGLVSLAAGSPGEFGVAHPPASWSASAFPSGRKAPAWGSIERHTKLLQTALLSRSPQAGSKSPQRPTESTATQHAANGAAPPPSAARPDPVPRAEPPRAEPPRVPARWGDLPLDSTTSLPAHRAAPTGSSPYAGLDTGAQSAIFGGQPNLSRGDQPTGQQPIVGLGGVAPTATSAEALPPELARLYDRYLRDVPPTSASSPGVPDWDGSLSGSTAHGPSPVAGAYQAPDPAGARAPTPEDSRADQLIFSQLRYQLETYIRLATRSYGVQVRGRDPASALDALRRSGHVDEADLRVAERILALADRIGGGEHATLEDYRQALMLYLLYHRARVGG